MSDPRKTQVSPQISDEVTLRDILQSLQGLFAYWPVLFLSACLGLIVAFVFNRYTADTYKVSATVAVEETENPLAASIDGMLNLGLGFGSTGIVDTRIAVLKSFAHNKRVARNLNSGLILFNKGRLNKREVYLPGHFTVDFDKNHDQLLGIEFDITFRENGFELETSREADELTVYNFGIAEEVESKELNSFQPETTEHGYDEWIEHPLYRFRIQRGPEFRDLLVDQKAMTSSFQFQSYDQLASWVIENLKTESNDKQQSSLLTLELEGHLIQKLADYLNASVDELQAYELREKNLMAVNTIQFIDSQLVQIEFDLKQSEAALERFRAENLIVDLGSEAEQMLEYFIQLEEEKASLNLQRSFYRYVLEFLENEQSYSGLSLPTLSTFNDPLVIQLAGQLVETSVSLERMSYSLDSNNPAILELQKEVSYTEQALYNATENALASSDLVMADIRSRLGEAQKKISRLPATEQQFINIQRQYEISGSQFQLLLEKRAEAGILQASNLPDTKIIDPAVDRGQEPVGPNRTLNYAIGFLLGLVLPSGVLLLANALNTKIRSRQDVERHTSIPIAGIAPHSKYGTNLVVLNKPKSSVSEAFRALRSNIKFIAKESDQGQAQVIAVTSSVGGEGKTFLSINLASVLSLGAQKVVLVGVDLRKPKIFNDFGLSNDVGLSNYLAGHADSSAIVQKSGYNNLDIVSGGVVPPNPSELIQSDRFAELMLELKGSYDYVILDTPPVGLVADALQVTPFLDAMLYVVRYNYTKANCCRLSRSSIPKGCVQCERHLE